MTPEERVYAAISGGIPDLVRQFHFPARKTLQGDDGKVCETDKNGKPIGIIDMEGGLITSLFETNKSLISE